MNIKLPGTTSLHMTLTIYFQLTRVLNKRLINMSILKILSKYESYFTSTCVLSILAKILINLSKMITYTKKTPDQVKTGFIYMTIGR